MIGARLTTAKDRSGSLSWRRSLPARPRARPLLGRPRPTLAPSARRWRNRRSSRAP